MCVWEYGLSFHASSFGLFFFPLSDTLVYLASACVCVNLCVEAMPLPRVCVMWSESAIRVTVVMWRSGRGGEGKADEQRWRLPSCCIIPGCARSSQMLWNISAGDGALAAARWRHFLSSHMHSLWLARVEWREEIWMVEHYKSWLSVES